MNIAFLSRVKSTILVFTILITRRTLAFCFHNSNTIHPTSLKVGKKNHVQITSSWNSNINDNDESTDNLNTIDSNLKRPPINIRKESILFSDNPTTAANNNISRTWISMRMNLPYIITGASKDDVSPVDKNPIGAIYNVMFVRLPTIFAGIVYTKNLVQGHPLYCDVGAGPFEIPPLIVYALLLVILR